MCRYVGKDINDWGEFVYVKTNAAELLKTAVLKLKNKGIGKRILFSSVTDPYQGVEAKYQITRKCLEVLVDADYQGLVSILTKSDLVLRDIDLFQKLKNIEIGLTITSFEDGISRYFEKYAPNVTQRFEALRKLNSEGLKTYAFVGPLLPHFVAYPEKLDELFKKIKETGTNDIYVEHINLSTYILNRLKKEAVGLDKAVLEKFYSSKNKDYRDQLDLIIKDCVKKHQLNIRLESAIYHKESLNSANITL